MQARIGGRTRIFALLGVPTVTFKSPLIYNPWFRSRGIDCVMVPMGCEAADFAEFLPLLFRLRNIAGALITMPHKVAAASLLDETGLAADICGSCNAVKRDRNDRLVGDMFDGEGFVAGLRGKGREAAGASALVAGSGGVGSAIAASLARAGAERLALFDIDGAACERLAGRLRANFPGPRPRNRIERPARPRHRRERNAGRHEARRPLACGRGTHRAGQLCR